MVCECSNSTQCCGCDPGGNEDSGATPRRKHLHICMADGTGMGLPSDCAVCKSLQPSSSQGKAATCTLEVVGTNHTPMVKGKPHAGMRR